jgi:hypothetical protein
MLQRGEIRPEPQDASARGRTGGQTYDKPRRCRLIARPGRKNLMQRALEKATMETGIG